MQFLGKVVDMPVLMQHWCFSPDSAEHCLEVCRCSSWTRLACPSCCNDRCFGPDSAEHCLEIHRCSSWTRCPCPSLWRLVPMARQRRIPVEIPQVQFLDKFGIAVVLNESALVQMCRKLWSSTVARSGMWRSLQELDSRRPATCTLVVRLLHGWISLVWTCAKACPKQQQQQ